jgi:NAD+ synthase (glutamine-hydrolysing)
MKSLPYGFFRAATASVPLRVADPAYNIGPVEAAVESAASRDVRLLVFPELCITGYSCGDLFHQETLLRAADAALESLLLKTASLDVVAVVGLPVPLDNRLFNCAAVVQSGRVLGVVPKSFLPGYGEFYEERWFSPGSAASSGSVFLAGREVPFGTDLLFRAAGNGAVKFGIEICEDLWAPLPPSGFQALAGALVLCNPSASNEVVGKHRYRSDLARLQSGRCAAAYLYAGSGVHESTTDLVFGGASLIAENGVLLAEGRRFSRDTDLTLADIDLDRLANERRRLTPFMDSVLSCGKTGGTQAPPAFRSVEFSLPEKPLKKLYRTVDPRPFVPADPKVRDERCEEIFSIQTAGLAKRIEASRVETAVIGISGGLDSTLALLVTVKTFDLLGLPRERILALTMPGFGTTEGTLRNARELMRSLGVSIREIDIRPACLLHFKDIGHDPEVHDTTYENVQARERTQLLMDTANKHRGLVIGTGDLSELALGWCTYNGDHMSMYAVNGSIPKTLVRYLVSWAAENVAEEAARTVLKAVLDTPISPELLPPDTEGKIRQKTEDILGPYEAHDFFLYHFFRYGAPPDKILHLACRAFEGVYDEKTLRKWLVIFLKRFFSQQFKRSCMPDGPKVGTVSLSPRGDWRMPSDAEASAWLETLGD